MTCCVGAVGKGYCVRDRDGVCVAWGADVRGVGVPVWVGGEVADGGPDCFGGRVDCGGAVPGPNAFGRGDVGGFEAGVG